MSWFTGKRVKILEKRINDLKEELKAKVDGTPIYNYSTGYYDFKKGLAQNVETLQNKAISLEAENKKLKAVVAELCDYVYKDKK